MRARWGRGSTLSPPRPRSGGQVLDRQDEDGVAVRCEDLTIGMRVVDGVLVLRLVGGLDRRSRPLLLRVAQRGVRAGSGDVAVDCAFLASCDDCGIDALGVLAQLPGVGSVVVRHADHALAQRLGAAGLAHRLGLGGASGHTASDG